MTQMGPDGWDAAELNSITERVIGAAFQVGNALGTGFLEKVYENALSHESRKRRLRVEQQRRLEVFYDGVVVGQFVADMVVDDCVIAEIKAVKSIDDAHRAQCLNYLAATGLPICLLINFGNRVEVKRIVGPNAPYFSPLHLGPSGSSVAPPTVGGIPATWAEVAEFGGDDEL